MIDFENVQQHGLVGAERLPESDHIFIFLPKNMKSASLELLDMVTRISAKVEIIKTTGAGANYLDFQLVTFLGALIAREQAEHFIIVSNDKGFDAAIDFWKRQPLDILVGRYKNISVALIETATVFPMREPAFREPTAYSSIGYDSVRTQNETAVRQNSPINSSSEVSIMQRRHPPQSTRL
ncbi:MAG: hypothetical protein LBG82_03220, partial [Clostridiales Family XIII bacterium]|nr:hypothetical protein [Clostridiales Family XIII bacterium]